MTHSEIEQHEIIERYVRGQLPPADRSMFEEHYFTCDECFAGVETTERFISGVRDAAATGVLGHAPAARQDSSPGWLGFLKPAFVVAIAVALILTGAVGWLLLYKVPSLRNEIAREREARERVEREDQEKLRLASEQLQREKEFHAKSENQPGQKLSPTPARPTNSSENVAHQKSPPQTGSPSGEQSETAEADATRSTNAGKPLSQVKRIYLEPLGNEQVTKHLRTLLLNKLTADGTFKVTNTKDDADAVMEISSKNGSVTLQLINSTGRVLWPRQGSRTYYGDVRTISARIVQELTDEIHRSSRQR